MSKDKPTSGSAAPVAAGAKAVPPAGGTAATSAAESNAAAKAGKPDKKGSAAKAPKPAKQKSSKGAAVLAFFALLISIGAGAGAGYLWYEQQEVRKQQTLLDQQQQDLAGQQKKLVVPAVPAISPELESRLTELTEKLAATGDTVSAEQRQLQAYRLDSSNDIERLAAENSDVMQRLVEIGRTDRDDWRLAEVEYLLRLAHQRVVMGGELDSAAALLATADKVLYELNMAGLLHVRKQVVRDLAAVQAAAKLDMAGIYLRLDALQQQVGNLSFFGMPSKFEEAEAAESGQPAQEGWRNELLAFSKQLVVVRKSDGEIEAELTGIGQSLTRIQLALNLEQAKNALLLKQGEIYHATLNNARQLVSTHFLPEDSVSVSFLNTLDALNSEAISPDLPDISASQQSIRAYIDNRYKSQGQAPAVEESPDPASGSSSEGGPSDSGEVE